VDWPARWKFLGVTFEAMGKDHAAAGSSWDTGVEIVEKVYAYPPPVRTVYEFVLVKGVGAMHSSTGTAVSATDMLHMTPPEVLRFLFMRYQPSKHIDFETGTWIVDLVESYDRVLADWYAEREGVGATSEGRPKAAEAGSTGPSSKSLLERRLGVGFADATRILVLSQPHGELPPRPPPEVPYSHLVFLLQIAPTWEDLLERLRRTGLLERVEGEEVEHLRIRAEHARFWLATYAPAEAKVTLRTALSEEASAALTPEQRRFLSRLASALESVPWSAQPIHDAVHATAQQAGVPTAQGFGAIYWLFLGRPKGPRAGHLLASLRRDDVLATIRSAA
jgi:lysyl-tRNA synthetase class 1